MPVLLAGFDTWGIRETISRVTGMFTIAYGIRS